MAPVTSPRPVRKGECWISTRASCSRLVKRDPDLEFGLGCRVMDSKLVMSVVRGAKPKADGLDTGIAHPPLAFRLRLVLHQIDARGDAFLRFLAEDAVEGGKASEGGAEEAIGPDKRGADRGAFVLDEAVEHGAAW